MQRANYTEEEKNTFQQLRFTYPDARIQRRFEILWLHACGKFAPEIALLVQQNPVTVREVINKFKQEGITLITTIESNHPTSELALRRRRFARCYISWRSNMLVVLS